MAYRRHNRRYRSSRRGRSRREEFSLLELMIESMIDGLIELLRGLVMLAAWGVRAMLRRAFAGWCVRPAIPPPPRFTPMPMPLKRPPASNSSEPAVERRCSTPDPMMLGKPAAQPAPQALPYRPARALLSKGERAFWFPLWRAVRGRYRIFCKVRLADVVNVSPSRRDERRWFRKIGSYHLDFVICDPRTTAPLLAVELDDHSHASSRRRELDRFKDQVLADAGVPIYRVTAQQAYDPIELRENIDRLIAQLENGT